MTGRARCGWPERPCRVAEGWHAPRPGERRPWGYHDQPCPLRSADPGTYPECALVVGHGGPCEYRPRLARPARPLRTAA